MEQSQQYQLGSWTICPRTNTISDQGESCVIDNKSMQVLLFLIQHAGEQVTKNQIIEHVWKGSFVTEDILSVTVSKIRKALGDNARSPTFIKTLSGVGYVLIAKVETIDDSKQPEKARNVKIYVGIFLLLIGFSVAFFFVQNQDTTSERLTISSIAVLPFDDLSAEQNNQYLTDGLSDTIINQLSQIAQLKVISRYSSFKYRGTYDATEIGQALQVDTLLDGSVQKSGEQVRINVRIFSTATGQQLWSKTFDSDTQDLFVLQDNISATIQEIIQPGYPAISKQNKPIDAQAYEWYLMGQYHWRQRNPESLSKALTYFKNSLELEPEFAESHVGLAITYAFLHTYGNWHEMRALNAAFPHVEQALLLKPDLPSALAAKGMLLSDKARVQASIGQLDLTLFQEAEQAFIRSLELEQSATTHQWYSSLLRRLDRVALAIEHMEQAVKLNPLSASLKRFYSFLLRSMGLHDSAQRMYQRSLDIDPDYFARPIDSARMNLYRQQSILAMARWQAANPELFTDCSSDEYCEQMVLAYLSIGAQKAADYILDNMASKHLHFRNWMNLLDAGLKGENEKVATRMEGGLLRQQDNRRALHNAAIAQFRAGQFTQSQLSLLRAYPEWRDKPVINQKDINADNYLALVLYAATLAKLNQSEASLAFMQQIQTFLEQDKVFDKVQAEFVLAQINAQIGNTPKALMHLGTALEQGWVETYNKEWWSLEDNHLLQPLREEPDFSLLLEQHQKRLSELREQVTLTLSATANFAE